MKISHIDHIVLAVKSIEKTVQFYESVLGMVAETFADGKVALKFGTQKINLHKEEDERYPRAEKPLPGSVDLCFITETELKKAMARVIEQGITVIAGPVTRTGATGSILSFYFRDPDGNLIEIANYAANS